MTTNFWFQDPFSLSLFSLFFFFFRLRSVYMGRIPSDFSQFSRIKSSTLPCLWNQWGVGKNIGNAMRCVRGALVGAKQGRREARGRRPSPGTLLRWHLPHPSGSHSRPRANLDVLSSIRRRTEDREKKKIGEKKVNYCTHVLLTKKIRSCEIFSRVIRSSNHTIKKFFLWSFSYFVLLLLVSSITVPWSQPNSLIKTVLSYFSTTQLIVQTSRYEHF